MPCRPPRCVHRHPVPGAQCAVPSLPGGGVWREEGRPGRGKESSEGKDLAAASTKGASVAHDFALVSTQHL